MISMGLMIIGKKNGGLIYFYAEKNKLINVRGIKELYIIEVDCREHYEEVSSKLCDKGLLDIDDDMIRGRVLPYVEMFRKIFYTKQRN
jgi:hypothetical protein